jgi:hypothetical protein
VLLVSAAEMHVSAAAMLVSAAAMLVSAAAMLVSAAAMLGTLTEGRDAVVLMPSIWEWDGGTSLFSDWIHWIGGVTKSVADKASTVGLASPQAGIIITAVNLGVQAAVAADDAGIIGQAQDRPIGMTRSKDANGKYTSKYEPPVLVYTYRSAESALARSVGGAPGVTRIELNDDPYYQGRYALYVQVQRYNGQCPRG